MGLDWDGEEVLNAGVLHLNHGIDHRRNNLLDVVLKRLEEMIADGVEHRANGRVGEFGVGEHVVMTLQTG